jgi:hypothetical protein
VGRGVTLNNLIEKPIHEITKHLELGTYMKRGDDYPRTLYAYIQLDSKKPHVNITTAYEPCKGVLDHWGSPDELIEELEWIIEKVKQLKKYMQESTK